MEPDEYSFDLLCDSVNAYDNIIPIKKGVSDRDGKVGFDFQKGSGSTIINTVADSDIDSQSTIYVSSLDSLMDEYGDICAVTMDIEVNELSALNGAMNTYKKCRPTFAVRVYHKKMI